MHTLQWNAIPNPLCDYFPKQKQFTHLAASAVFVDIMPFAKVDVNTPTTIPPNDAASSQLSTSIFHSTATDALVIGSAALTVSTKDASLA
mmetsp:Transcript_21529/g.31840  ORF Transcript_21529/g.31840 Transcript_21529/m.31840 type:complete len:90 (+) Transcript_21529:957-1226(+)